MARRYGRSLHRTDCRDNRQLEHFPRKLCKLVGKEAKRPPPMVQTDEARSYFSQVRIIIHVIAATPSGTIPWVGKNLLVGIVPLGVAAITWIIMRTWLKYDRASSV